VIGADASGADGELLPRATVVFDELRVRPYFDVRTYSRMLIESPVIEYGASGQPVAPDRRAWLHGIVEAAFRDELAKSAYFRSATSPADDVLLVRIKLTDVVSYAGAANLNLALADVGEATLVLELYDSMSKTITVRATARVKAEGPRDDAHAATMATDQIVERAARDWARRIRERLDTIASVELNPQEAPAPTR
jgi:hypothetical protein